MLSFFNLNNVITFLDVFMIRKRTKNWEVCSRTAMAAKDASEWERWQWVERALCIKFAITQLVAISEQFFHQRIRLSCIRLPYRTVPRALEVVCDTVGFKILTKINSVTFNAVKVHKCILVINLFRVIVRYVVTSQIYTNSLLLPPSESIPRPNLIQ